MQGSMLEPMTPKPWALDHDYRARHKIPFSGAGLKPNQTVAKHLSPSPSFFIREIYEKYK